ncbi:hypothetical protein [Catellatospora citrea]|nr:hypothetical protein [Catellatospora citrea]RKE12192.1 hypothetical protein C8E86_7129 [Catellatospora citrea]
MADQVAAADGGHLAGHAPEADRERRRKRRRRWWMFTATALGLLLCVQPLFSGGDDGSAPSSWQPDTVPDGRWSMGVAQPTAGPIPTSAPAATTAAPEPTSAAPPRPAPTGSARPSQTPGPVLLGPSGKAGVQDLAQEYCDRHGGGASAGPRLDGRWQCVRLLLFVSIVDMDVACADTYDKAAYAQTSDPDDAYAWRCYQR